MRYALALACVLGLACVSEEEPEVLEWHCWCNAVCDSQTAGAEGSICSYEEDVESNLQAAANACDAEMIAAGCTYHNCACACDSEPTGSCE